MVRLSTCDDFVDQSVIFPTIQYNHSQSCRKDFHLGEENEPLELQKAWEL